MNKWIIILILLLGANTEGLAQERTFFKHSISLGGAYSYQTFLDVGQELYSDNFSKKRSGLLIESIYDYYSNGFLLKAGFGINGNSHRRDSVSLYYGSVGATKGYSKDIYFYLRSLVGVGYGIIINSKIRLSLVIGGNANLRFMRKNRSYTYDDKLYRASDLGNISTYPGAYQFKLKTEGLIFLENNNVFGFYIEYNRPFTRLDKAYLAFQEFNLGFSYTLWQSKNSETPK